MMMMIVSQLLVCVSPQLQAPATQRRLRVAGIVSHYILSKDEILIGR